MSKSGLRSLTTGVSACITFFIIGLGSWFMFSDPRGPVGAFPYPFVMWLAVMILVGLWQHLVFGNWPFEKLGQPAQGVVLTVINFILVIFVIKFVFYRFFGLGFNFLSQTNLNELAEAGKAILPNGVNMTIEVMKAKHLAESAIVSFVLIGFFSYPVITILFERWPIRPSDLKQPQAGLAELGWGSLFTLFCFVSLIVPWWGLVYSQQLGTSFGFNTPWWGSINGTNHLHWVFGWWEWAIVILFMTANVWRGKPWSCIRLPQPWKGLLSLIGVIAIGYVMALLCVNIAPWWLPKETVHHLTQAGDLTRFLWYHSAEIAGFFLLPFLLWHHYFDDLTPFSDKDSWNGFVFRTSGVVVLAVINYCFYYYANFGGWGLGNPHMMGPLADRFVHGESLVWNFWSIIPLLWNEWFFKKWGFQSPAKP